MRRRRSRERGKSRPQVAPRRVHIAQATLGEHSYAANCLKFSRVSAQRPVAGSRRSEERRARLEAILRANSDPGIVRADRRMS
eukprot:13679135-Alexandrium_andersonii.AAC.1